MSKKEYCKLYKKTHYYLPIFGVNINFVFNKKDFKYLAEKYQDFIYDREVSNNGECLMNYENREITIGIFNNDLGTVIHELTHATLFVLETGYMNPHDSNGEVMAYIQQHLFYEIQKRMKSK